MRIAKFSIGYIEELSNFILNRLDPVLQERISLYDFSMYENNIYLKFVFKPSVADSPFMRCSHHFTPYKAYTAKIPKTCEGMPTDDDYYNLDIPCVYNSDVNENGFIGLARHHSKLFAPEWYYQSTFTHDEKEEIEIDEDRIIAIMRDLDEYARVNLMSLSFIEIKQVD